MKKGISRYPRWAPTIPLSYFKQFHMYDFEGRRGKVIDYGEDALGPLVVVEHEEVIEYVRPMGTRYLTGQWYAFNGWIGKVLSVYGDIVTVLHYDIKEYAVGRPRLKRITTRSFPRPVVGAWRHSRSSRQGVSADDNLC